MKITRITKKCLQHNEIELGYLGKYDLVLDDEIVLHKIILKRYAGKWRLQYPSYRAGSQYNNFCYPITREMGDYLLRTVKEFYEKGMANEIESHRN